MEKSREKKCQQAFMAKMRMRKFRALKKIKRRLQRISNDESMSAMDIDSSLLIIQKQTPIRDYMEMPAMN